MPLVLVQNPVIVSPGYNWKDIEGEQLSEAAKKGTSLAVETEPGVGLRSGLRWAEEWGRNNCFPLSGRIVLGFD